MAKTHRNYSGSGPSGLSWHYPDEVAHGTNPLPHEGSHAQGNHPSELAPHSSTHPMQQRDRKPPHSADSM